MGIFGVPDSKTFVESWRTITESREIQMKKKTRDNKEKGKKFFRQMFLLI